jgi:hypothetical protein
MQFHSLEQLANFLHDHMHEMHFKLATPTLVTIHYEDDEDGDKILLLHDVLTGIYQAYHSSPFSLGVPGTPNTWSFGFRSQKLIDEARRVIPLPEDLQPGEPVYLAKFR